MAEPMLLPWRKMWDFIAWCGEARDLHQMLCNAVQALPRLVSCENAFACRADVLSGGRVSVSLEADGFPAPAVQAYCQRFFFEDIVHSYMDRDSVTYEMDWSQSRLRDNGFVRTFIHEMLRIDFSGGIPIFDADGTGGVNLGLTRVGCPRFSTREQAILRGLRRPFENL